MINKASVQSSAAIVHNHYDFKPLPGCRSETKSRLDDRFFLPFVGICSACFRKAPKRGWRFASLGSGIWLLRSPRWVYSFLETTTLGDGTMVNSYLRFLIENDLGDQYPFYRVSLTAITFQEFVRENTVDLPEKLFS
jgi:hypothetical protein